MTLVGGPTAAQVDTTDALVSRLPLVSGFIATVTLLALVAMLGSVLVPLQALLLNVLGLGATIVSGMRHTGCIIAFAALLLLATVFAGFITSSVTSIKLLGTGLALAVLLDACVLRTLLAPALLRITGHASWWAPAPVHRLGARFGLSEHGTPPVYDARPQAPVAPATVAAQPSAVHPQQSAGGR